VDAFVTRSRFDKPEELAAFVVENRRAMSAPKLAEAAGLSLVEYHRLLRDRRFRQFISESLALEVMDLDQEERMLKGFMRDAVSADTVWERRAAAELVMKAAGVERASETRVDYGGEVRVRFELDRPEPGAWTPPDPLAGVVGASPKNALGRGAPAEPSRALEVGRAPAPSADDSEAARRSFLEAIRANEERIITVGAD
jgi:hypothetical protein